MITQIIKKIFFSSMAVLFVLMIFINPGIAAPVEIKIGAAFDITGPYSDLGMVRAYQDCIKWVNEQGGFKDIKGQTCKIELVWQDCASNIPKAMAAYKDFKARGCVVHYYSSTGQNYALKKKAQKDKIPLVSQLVSNIVFEGEDSWIYAQYGQREGAIMAIDGLKQALPKIFKKDRPPKIGFLGWNNAVGEDYVPFAKAYAKQKGFVIGPDEYISMKALDVTPQLRKLGEAKCDYVFLGIAGGQEVMVIKNQYDLGLKKDFTFILLNPAVQAWATIKRMDPKYYNGNLMISSFAVYDDDSQGTKLMIDLQKKYHKGDVMKDLFEDYAWGFHSAYVTVAAIKKAVQKVPGNELTGEDVKEYGLDSLKIDTKELSMGASYSDYPGDRVAIMGGKLCEERDGKLTPLTGWIPCAYQAPHSPTAPAWIKTASGEMMKFYKQKRKKKK